MDEKKKAKKTQMILGFFVSDDLMVVVPVLSSRFTSQTTPVQSLIIMVSS